MEAIISCTAQIALIVFLVVFVIRIRKMPDTTYKERAELEYLLTIFVLYGSFLGYHLCHILRQGKS